VTSILRLISTAYRCSYHTSNLRVIVLQIAQTRLQVSSQHVSPSTTRPCHSRLHYLNNAKLYGYLGQYDSHTIIGTGELDQPCGDYSFSIIAPNSGSTTVPASTTPSTSTSTSAPSSTGPPGWPTITGAACFSGTPQGQKEFHGSRASAFMYVPPLLLRVELFFHLAKQ